MRKVMLWLIGISLPVAAIVAFANASPISIDEGRTDEYPVTSVAISDDADAAIFVIGVYEGGSDHSAGNHPVNPITITIANASGEPIKLALSSYEPAEWNIIGPGAGRVEAVYLSGYHRHSILGLGDAKVINLSGSDARRSASSARDYGDDWGQSATNRAAPKWISCAFTYPDVSGGGCGAGSDLVANANNLLNGKTRHFTGTYNARAFTISD